MISGLFVGITTAALPACIAFASYPSDTGVYACAITGDFAPVRKPAGDVQYTNLWRRNTIEKEREGEKRRRQESICWEGGELVSLGPKSSQLDLSGVQDECIMFFLRKHFGHPLPGQSKIDLGCLVLYTEPPITDMCCSCVCPPPELHSVSLPTSPSAALLSHALAIPLSVCLPLSIQLSLYLFISISFFSRPFCYSVLDVSSSRHPRLKQPS